jgi:hypothetical protein
MTPVTNAVLQHQKWCLASLLRALSSREAKQEAQQQHAASCGGNSVVPGSFGDPPYLGCYHRNDAPEQKEVHEQEAPQERYSDPKAVLADVYRQPQWV